MPMIKTRLYILKVYLDKRENIAIQANVDRSFSYVEHVLIGLQSTFKDQ